MQQKRPVTRTEIEVTEDDMELYKPASIEFKKDLLTIN